MGRIWLLYCENKVYRELLGAYSTYMKAIYASEREQKKFGISETDSINFYVVEIELDKEKENHE